MFPAFGFGARIPPEYTVSENRSFAVKKDNLGFPHRNSVFWPLIKICKYSPKTQKWSSEPVRLAPGILSFDETISWYSGWVFSEMPMKSPIVELLIGIVRDWENTQEVDLHWLRTYLFRCPLKKRAIDNANCECPWWERLQIPLYQISQHLRFGERHRKVPKENHSGLGHWKAERFLWKHWSPIWYWFLMNKEDKDCAERFALQWSRGNALWYTRCSCGTLSRENSAPTGGRALERQ